MANDTELRYFQFEDDVRATDSRRIRGYAVVFNEYADIGPFMEVIEPTAVNRTLTQNVDVRALVDHDWSKVIGRRSAGTLRLTSDARGLAVEVDVPETTAGNDLLVSIRRGDYTGMSFKIADPVYDWRRHSSGKRLGVLRDMLIPEVSVVSNPAYPQTSVSMRSLQEFEAAEQHGKSIAFLKRLQRQRDLERQR